MSRHFKFLQKRIIRGTLYAGGPIGVSTQKDMLHFDLTDDDRSTYSSFEFISDVFKLITILTSGWTLGDETSPIEISNIISLNMIYVHQCECQSSFNQMMVSSPKQLTLLPFVDPPRMNGAKELWLWNLAVGCTIRAYYQNSFQNVEKSSDKRTRGIWSSIVSLPSLVCFILYGYFAIADSSTSSPSTFYMSAQQSRAFPEEPPLLHLHKHPDEFAFPDRLSCVISPRPDRLQVRKTSENHAYLDAVPQ